MSLTREALNRMSASLSRRENEATNRVHDEIKRLGLADNLIEIEAAGFTTLKGVLSQEVVERAIDAILDHIEATTGKRIDVNTATEEDYRGMTYLPYLLYQNQVFEDILLAEKPLALMNYLLGESRLLSSLGCHFKGPGQDGALPLHSDNGNGMVSPFPPYAQTANINYALTPYSREAGALAMVPGSHRWARQPTPDEMVLGGELGNPAAISMDLEPGDAVVWHGNTWHGSFARQIPGIRINLAVYMCRQYIVTQERHKDVVPADFLARHANDERMSILLGAKQPYGWQDEGPDYSLMGRAPKSRFD